MAAWQQTVESFATLLRTHGIDADLDLWHSTETTIDWTRWGPTKVLHGDFVIVALSDAWKQRWQGTNAPTVGAGAVAEADTLKGIFGHNQTEFQRKTMLAVLPGVSSDVVPEDLYRLTRFQIAELSRHGIDDLLRTIFNAPKHMRPPVGPTPSFDAPPPLPPPSPARPTTPFEAVGRDEYLARAMRVSERRGIHRRRGAGLTDVQVQRTLGYHADIPDPLRQLGAGEFRVLYGPLGSGKSDIAEQWLQSNIAAAGADPNAAIPVWITIDDLETALEPHILTEVGLAALTRFGVDIVVDGLDERTNKAAALTRQAGELVNKWPSCRLLLTTRTPERLDASVLIEAPPLTGEQANRLMAAVAGHPVAPLGPQLEIAVTRPLFALLVAQHVTASEGATGIPEIVDRIVQDVVSREDYNLFTELRALAVETIRAGGPVDPSSIASADVAAKVRASSLVTSIGRKCGFALATFEQWFAAQAILDGHVGIDELLASMDTFNRWRYVLAIIAATADPARGDQVLAALARWNPGAASWVVNETRTGGLTRASPDIGPQDWESVGKRLQTAMQAWLHGLGPLANCFSPVRSFGISSFDDLTVAIEISDRHLHVWWLPRYQIPNHPLPAVVEPTVLRPGRPRRGFHMTQFQVPTAINGVWEITRDHLAGDLTDSFVARTLEIGSQQFGVASEEIRVLNDAMQAMDDAPPNFKGNLDIERLYPAADIAPAPTNRFGGYTTKAMYRYSLAVIDAAMRCYLELSSWVTPRFGRTLALRGLMPAEFFGTMFYNPDDIPSPYEFPGMREPGFAWLVRPIGATPSDDVRPEDNHISLTVNDSAREDKLRNDKSELYESFRSFIEANPVYEPFAGPFTIHHGRLDIFHRTPATRLAMRWLWDDLKTLGFLTGTAPQNI